MALQRGVSEYVYVSTVTWRIFFIHVAAYYKDRFLVLRLVTSALFGGEDSVAGGDAPRARSRTPERIDPQNPRLPSWFRRKPGVRYTVAHVEGPLGAIKSIARVSQGKN